MSSLLRSIQYCVIMKARSLLKRGPNSVIRASRLSRGDEGGGAGGSRGGAGVGGVQGVVGGV